MLDGIVKSLAHAKDVFAAWGLAATPAQLAIHDALITRTLTPDEAHLRAAAEWLSALYSYNLVHPRFKPQALALAIDEWSCRLHRLAHRHAPGLARELELPGSPLFAIDQTARFVPTQTVGTELLLRLRNMISAEFLPELPRAGTDPTWHVNRRNLQQLILTDNPARFLTWPVIANAMFMNDSQVATVELAALQAQSDFGSRWMPPALCEDPLGAPARTPVHPETSNNLIHHAYNLLQFETHAGLRVDQVESILEFGGGYGSTARLARRLGFKGKYIIFDLPEFSALQRFFLGTIGLEVGMEFVTSITDLPVEPELFLATWSLSETPIAFCAGFAEVLAESRHLLIAYQEHFGDADNMAWFADLGCARARGKVEDYKIGHLAGNRYFVSSHPKGLPVA